MYFFGTVLYLFIYWNIENVNKDKWQVGSSSHLKFVKSDGKYEKFQEKNLKNYKIIINLRKIVTWNNEKINLSSQRK